MRDKTKQAHPATPLPMGRILTLGLILAANNSSIWMIFSFLPFLVSFFYPTFAKGELGYRAGILGSAFSCGSFFGNLIWGNLSDRIGRRPVILIGLSGTFVSAILFAFSPTYATAVFARFLWGLLNGNIGVCKTYMSEILDDTNNTRGMAVFGVIGGVGRTIGPLVGAFFSEPARSYPALFKDTVFDRFPFALPSIVLAINCALVMVMAFCTLQETLVLKANSGSVQQLQLIDSPTAEESKNKHFFIDEDDEEDQEGDVRNALHTPSSLGRRASGIQMIALGSSSAQQKYTSLPSNSSDDCEEGVSESKADENTSDVTADVTDVNSNGSNSSPRALVKRVSFSALVEVKTIDNAAPPFNKNLKSVSLHVDVPIVAEAVSQETQQDEESGFSGAEGSRLLQESPEKNSSTNQNRRETESTEGLFPKHYRFDNGGSTIERQQGDGCCSTVNQMVLLMRKPSIFTSTMLFGFCGLIQMGTTEVFPLWVVTDRSSGGMSFNTSDIAMVTMISGILVIISQLGIYSAIVSKVGLLRTYWFGCIINAVTMLALPHLAMVSGGKHSIANWLLLSASLSAQSVSMMWTLTSVFVFINNSCYSHQRGTVNGIGQSLSSLGRLIGPVGFSYMFAWSENNNAMYPFNYFLCFYLLAILSLVNAYGCTLLPRSIERRKREPSAKATG